MLTIIDEYSGFLFAVPCCDMTSKTVIKCLSQIFSMFGMPAYIHSDRGKSLLSQDMIIFLHQYGIATSRTTPYNPEEKYLSKNTLSITAIFPDIEPIFIRTFLVVSIIVIIILVIKFVFLSIFLIL